MLKQSLQQKLLQKLSPQQIQLMKLLQVPTLELEARIKQEMEANPALEEGVDREEMQDDLDPQDEETSESLEDFDFDEYLDDETPDYQLSIHNYGADVEDKDIPLGSGASFRELLVDQLGLLDVSRELRALAEHVIGHLDDAGYLRRDLESIVNDLAFTQGVDVPQSLLEEALAACLGRRCRGCRGTTSQAPPRRETGEEVWADLEGDRRKLGAVCWSST